MQRGAHYFRLAADQELVGAQCLYGFCLQKGEGVSIHMQRGAHDLKLDADQGRAEVECHYGLCMLAGVGL
jgi:TPR repeat protein